MEKKRSSFGGSIGFVLAAAGSAVGLGNIWRFPYLAARDGGGTFLLIYIILALTFGFTLMTSEIAIGRKTKQSPLTAYQYVNEKAKHLGLISFIVPVLIFPYYCVIGGWVVKYFVVYLTGQGEAATADDYFSGFITAQISPIVFMAIFLILACLIVYRGVNEGIEASSKIIMPALIVIIIGISLYALTISHTDAEGVTRTGLQGFKVFVVPDFHGMTPAKFFSILMDAMGQLFYSLSVAMGILIAYGSYVSDDSNLMKSINQIEFFDTLVAFLAGMLIIPAVFTFMGSEGMAASGPGLMFISLPKVFSAMGIMGKILGALFFLMVFFAALTSAVSLFEAIVSSVIDRFHVTRSKATIIMTVISFVMALVVCLGYNVLYFEVKLPNGATAQILDIADYISNNILMPIGSIGTCILIGWVVKPKYVIDEVTRNGEYFNRRRLYYVMVRYIAPVLLVLLFLQSFGILSLIFNKLG